MTGAFAGVRAIFFDVDNTLYDFERSMEFAFAHLRKAFPEVLGAHHEDRLAEAYWSYYHSYDESAKVALINRDPDLFRRTMWVGALRNLGATTEDPFVDELTREFQAQRAAQWRAAMYPGAAELLRDLKKRGITIGAITNGPSPVQRPKLEALSYREHFPEELVFVSGEFGTRKPHAAIFEAAARAARVAPDRCLMVGDAREFDMPAKAIGFRTVLFDGKEERPDCRNDPYPPDAIVTSYEELRALLSGLGL